MERKTMSNDTHPSIDDLIELPAPGDPQISPDGQWIAYTRWIWKETPAKPEPVPCYIALVETGVEEERHDKKITGPVSEVLQWARRDQAEFRWFSAPSGLTPDGQDLPPGERFPRPEQVSLLASRVAGQIQECGFQKLVLYTGQVKKNSAAQIALGCLHVAAGIAGGVIIEHQEISDPGW
jgi:hypothetical protein